MAPPAQTYNELIRAIRAAVDAAKSRYAAPTATGGCRHAPGRGDVLSLASSAVVVWREMVPTFADANIAAAAGVPEDFVPAIAANDEAAVASVAIDAELVRALTTTVGALRDWVWHVEVTDAVAAGFVFGALDERVPPRERQVMVATEINRWNTNRRAAIETDVRRVARLMDMRPETAHCVELNDVALLATHPTVMRAYWCLRDDHGCDHVGAATRIESNVYRSLECADDNGNGYAVSNWAKTTDATALEALMCAQHGDVFSAGAFYLTSTDGTPLPPLFMLVAAESAAARVVWTDGSQA